MLAAWIGGSVLASLPSFQDEWITIDNYAEKGSKVIHLMCMWHLEDRREIIVLYQFWNFLRISDLENDFNRILIEYS